MKVEHFIVKIREEEARTIFYALQSSLRSGIGIEIEYQKDNFDKDPLGECDTLWEFLDNNPTLKGYQEVLSEVARETGDWQDYQRTIDRLKNKFTSDEGS